MINHYFHVTTTERKIYLHLYYDCFNSKTIYFDRRGLILKLNNKTLAFQAHFNIEDIIEYDHLVKEISY